MNIQSKIEETVKENFIFRTIRNFQFLMSKINFFLMISRKISSFLGPIPVIKIDYFLIYCLFFPDLIRTADVFSEPGVTNFSQLLFNGHGERQELIVGAR